MKVLKENPQEIDVLDMTDGQIAVITGWGIYYTRYIGRVVQRWGESLITLGENSGHGWLGFFMGRKRDPDLRVRILPKGTKLEI